MTAQAVPLLNDFNYGNRAYMSPMVTLDDMANNMNSMRTVILEHPLINDYRFEVVIDDGRVLMFNGEGFPSLPDEIHTNLLMTKHYHNVDEQTCTLVFRFGSPPWAGLVRAQTWYMARRNLEHHNTDEFDKTVGRLMERIKFADAIQPAYCVNIYSLMVNTDLLLRIRNEYT